jgi:hypothetical protein
VKWVNTGKLKSVTYSGGERIWYSINSVKSNPEKSFPSSSQIKSRFIKMSLGK